MLGSIVNLEFFLFDCNFISDWEARCFYVTCEFETICKKLKPIPCSQAHALWYSSFPSDNADRFNLKLEIQIIAERCLEDALLQKTKSFYSPPSIEDFRGSYVRESVQYKERRIRLVYLPKRVSSVK